MNLKVLCCKPIEETVRKLAENSPHQITVKAFLPDDIKKSLKEEILNTHSQTDFIVIVAGECATLGIVGEDVEIIVPKVHNCSHLILGSYLYQKACEQSEDCPSWQLEPPCSYCQNSFGVNNLATIKNVITEENPTTKIWHGEAKLLKAMLKGDFSSNSLLLVTQNMKVVEDSLEIILTEPN